MPLCKNKVTEAAASAQYKLEDNSPGSNSSTLKSKRILLTTAKKGDLRILTGIPFNLSMNGLDAKLKHVVAMLLEGAGTSNLISLC